MSDRHDEVYTTIKPSAASGLSARRKTQIVARVMRGEEVGALSHEIHVPVHEIAGWKLPSWPLAFHRISDRWRWLLLIVIVLGGGRLLNGLLSALVNVLNRTQFGTDWLLGNLYIGESVLFGVSGFIFVVLATLVAPTARLRTAASVVLFELFVTWSLLGARDPELASISRGYTVGAILGALSAVALVRNREAHMRRALLSEARA